MPDPQPSASTATIAPPLMPPLLEVGYNYTWPFNRYGTSIGPRDIQNDPPTGATDSVPVFDDKALVPPNGSLARNLAILRDELKITKVRMFLLANAFNYGKRPIAGTPSGRFFFTAPSPSHPLFFSHFRQMLQVFKASQMKVMPSLLDFGAIYPLGGGAGGGRTSILTSQRTTFLEQMLKPLLGVCQEPGLEDTIFAWELMNEPVWNTIAIPIVGRPHTDSSGPDIDEGVMASFLGDCTKVIEGAGFKSTVGHRFFADLSKSMPTGSLPQFHYYGRTSFAANLVNLGDPDSIPTFSEARGAFVGEFAVAPGGSKNQFGDEEPGAQWPDCQGKDGNRSSAAFERLKVLARKGYKLAFAWPDRSDKEPGVANQDELKLTDDAKTAIKRFTLGRFPNGVP